MAAPLSLLESAALLGQYRFVELVGFASLGARARTSADGELCLVLAGAARAHGHRAALIEARLPVSLGLPHAAELTWPAGPSAEACFAHLASLGDDALPAHLLALYEQMDGAYEAHARRCSPYSDPPVLRMLSRLRDDLRARCGELQVLAARPVGADKEMAVAREAVAGFLPLFGSLPAE